MRRAALAPIAAAWLLVAGCPLPQALPEYTATTVTPPRILADAAPYADAAVVLVPAGCPTTAEPAYPLGATIVDSTTYESVEARWFVNYDYGRSPWSDIQKSAFIEPNADATNLYRIVPTWTFRPYDHPAPYGTSALPGPPWAAAGVVRVVELVVSNGFDPAKMVEVAGYVAGVNRAPKPGFATQVHRWVFLTVPESPSVPCPTP